MSNFEFNEVFNDLYNLAESLKLSHGDYFSGTHRGIPFKIQRHNSKCLHRSNDQRYNCWCYYIYLKQDNFSEEDWTKIYKEPEISGKYYLYSSDILDNCDFYGGITWFEVTCDPANPDKVNLEVGCDYNHSWDSDKNWSSTVQSVYSDVKNTIEKLHSLCELRVWSYIDGTFHTEKTIEEYNEEKIEAYNEGK